MSYSMLLSIIGRIQPEAWDAIVPHSPLTRVPAGKPGLGQVALNPQPLPPGEPLVTAAADLAHEVVRAAVTTDMQGGSSSALISDLIDDWCGTPWPRKWPWPSPGPRPEPEPDPVPWDVQTARVAGALIFASMASRLSQGELRDTLTKGADRLAEAALAGER